MYSIWRSVVTAISYRKAIRYHDKKDSDRRQKMNWSFVWPKLLLGPWVSIAFWCLLRPETLNVLEFYMVQTTIATRSLKIWYLHILMRILKHQTSWSFWHPKRIKKGSLYFILQVAIFKVLFVCLRHESGNGGSLSLFEGNGDQLRNNVMTMADGQCQEQDEKPR